MKDFLVQKKGNAHYTLFPKKIMDEYNILTGQRLDGRIERRDNGVSFHLDIKESTILERDVALLERILEDNLNMPKRSVYIQFNPHDKNKKIMQGRLDAAYENIVRRDSE